MGVFLDPKKETRNTASLTRCDCKDFNFSGNSPRKCFKPCMHIYRLAMELGLLEMKYEDSKAKDSEYLSKKNLRLYGFKISIKTPASGERGIV